jgi:hypothetical protein
MNATAERPSDLCLGVYIEVIQPNTSVVLCTVMGHHPLARMHARL